MGKRQKDRIKKNKVFVFGFEGIPLSSWPHGSVG